MILGQAAKFRAEAADTAAGEARMTLAANAETLTQPKRTTAPAGRQRRAEPVTNRVRRDGKFFRLGAEKFYIKGLTYGPFAPGRDGPFPDRQRVRADFAQIRELGANC